MTVLEMVKAYLREKEEPLEKKAEAYSLMAGTQTKGIEKLKASVRAEMDLLEDEVIELQGLEHDLFKLDTGGSGSFDEWVMELANEDRRRELGDKMDLHLLAMQSARKRLMRPHRFDDGSIDCPILNSEAMALLDEEEKEAARNE